MSRVPPPGAPTRWTPPASLRDWKAEYDPTGPRYANNAGFAQYVAQLMGASPDAFAALEQQLSSTANLARITAQGLEDAKAADWQGEAADQYRRTLDKLPKDLDQVHQSYTTALNLVTAFADTTFQLKAQYGTFQQELAALRQSWDAALDTTYPDAATGWSAIHRLQGELSQLCSSGMRTLQKSVDAWEELNQRVSPLTAAAPHEGNLTKALAPIRWIEDAAKDLWDGVTGTWGAINAFAAHPTWANMGRMTEDLGIDASVVILAATAPEALPAMVELDGGVEGTMLAISGGIKAGATGVEIGANVMNVTSEVGEGQYGSALLEAALLGKGVSSDFAAGEVDEALTDETALDDYESRLATGMGPAAAFEGLSEKDVETLKELGIDDTTSPLAVRKAYLNAPKDVNKALSGEALDGAKDFGKDHFLIDPAVKTVTPALPGNRGGGSGG